MMKYPGLESSELEFKEELPKNNQIIKTVIAFCNAHGGKIVIGVADNGKIIGVDEREAHEAMEWLDKAIYEACVPPIIPLVYQQRVHDKVLIIIDVAPGANKPYYQKSLGLGKGAYIRLGRSTMLANAEIIEELKWHSRGISYDQLPVYHTSKEDLDFSEIERFFNHRKNNAKTKIHDELLLGYSILTKEHTRLLPTVAGILLFGKNPQEHLSEAYLSCSHFSGTSGRKALASRTMNGRLMEQFESAYDFIIERLNKSFEIVGKKRVEKLEIPPQAIREALMNAILHRNYHINAPIKVAIYNDRVEIFSPGTFPGPIDVTNLETGITYVRNIKIAKILWEAGYIEKMGSGFIEIFSSYRGVNLQLPIVQEGTNFIKCILPRKTANTDEDRQKLSVLNLFQIAEEISRADVIKLGIPKTTAGRLLAQLTTEGKLEKKGKGKNTTYRLRQ